jgi:hypothetical protein
VKYSDGTGYTLLGAGFGTAVGVLLYLSVMNLIPREGDLLVDLVVIACVAPILCIAFGTALGAWVFGAVFKAATRNCEQGEPPPK